jgi:hypothetical protein
MKCNHNLLLQAGFAVAAGAFSALIAGSGVTDTVPSKTPLQVAYAGSMGSMMDGGIRPAIADALGVEFQGRGGIHRPGQPDRRG